MTKTAHTPGPWQVRSGIDGSPRMDSRDGYTVERADPTAGKPFVVSTWSLPNARLIAAAPELLEALRDLAREAARNIYPKPDVGPEHPYSILRRAEVAIAKAEGK